MKILELINRLLDPCPAKCSSNGYISGCSFCLPEIPEKPFEYRKYTDTIMERGLDFYDYKKLDQGAWNTYYADATAILGNETFNNELNNYKADLVKFIAFEAKNWDQVINLRTALITLETFKERLESIENPHKTQNTNGIFEAL